MSTATHRARLHSYSSISLARHVIVVYGQPVTASVHEHVLLDRMYPKYKENTYARSVISNVYRNGALHYHILCAFVWRAWLYIYLT